MLRSLARRTTLWSVLLSIPACAIPAAAQQNPAPLPGQGKNFDVVSIRRNLALGAGRPNLTPSPDGFRVIHVPALLVLMTAYTPKAGGMFLKNIENMPDWLRQEAYDIDARIADEDRAAWNDPKNQPAMLQQMLQSMLASRFQLVVHRQMKENPVYDLVTAKGGIKFAETKADQPLPTGWTLPDGARIVPGPDGLTHMYNLTMQMFATVLSEKSDRPVVDKTGLAGHYNLDIREPANETAPSAAPETSHDLDSRPPLADVVKGLGLELKPAREQAEFLVIDRIERPTEN